MKPSTRRLLLLCLALVLGSILVFNLTRPQRLTPSRQVLQQAFPGDSRDILEHADHWTLLSLDPSPVSISQGGFHDYRILGQTEIASPKVRAELLVALDDGIARADPLPPCFSPRHGLRATQGKKTVDLVICFHCHQFEIYEGQTKSLAGTSGTPQPAFDRVLSAAGIRLAKP